MSNSKNNFGNAALITIIIVLLLYTGFITYWHLSGRMMSKESVDKSNQQLKEHGIDPDEFSFEKDIIYP